MSAPSENKFFRVAILARPAPRQVLYYELQEAVLFFWLFDADAATARQRAETIARALYWEFESNEGRVQELKSSVDHGPLLHRKFGPDEFRDWQAICEEQSRRAHDSGMGRAINGKYPGDDRNILDNFEDPI